MSLLVSGAWVASAGNGNASRQGGAGMPGGVAVAKVGDKDVIDAAAFAVKAQEAVMRKELPATKLSLVKVVRASKQVVSGLNYTLRLTVKDGDKEKEAEAKVWWQAWRATPYELSSWTWK